MDGIKVASLVIGLTLLLLAAIVGLALLLMSWWGPIVGGVVAFGIVIVAMFVFIAVAENR